MPRPSRFDDVPLPFTSSAQIPARQPARGASVKRSKTLTRPDRHVAPAPLIAPPPTHFSDQASPLGGGGAGGDPRGNRDWWVIWCYATTFWAPPVLLGWFGIKEKQSRQAWREKITLCWIAIMLGGVIGFATMGLQRALCPGGEDNTVFDRVGSNASELPCPGRVDMRQTDFLVTVSISGWTFNISTSLTQANVDFYQASSVLPGIDVTNLFQRTAAEFPACTSNLRYATTPYCNTTASSRGETGVLQRCPLGALGNATFNTLRIQNTTGQAGYSWEQVASLEDYMVIDGNVLNMLPYLRANPVAIPDDSVDAAIRQVIRNQSEYGKDATRLFHNNRETHAAINCLTSRYLAGRIDRITPGCFIAALFLYTSLIVILGVVLIRFAMACIFNWFLSAKLVRPPDDLGRNAISPAVMPEGANMSVHNKNGTAPWAGGSGAGAGGAGGTGPRKLRNKGPIGLGSGSSSTLVNSSNNGNSTTIEPTITLAQIGRELFTVCLVTCYSEGEDSVRGTVESIAATNYSDKRKLIWIVCDGMITGQGEKMSTPDICVSMLSADARFGNPMPMGYIAVGSGAHRENRAMVYAGHTGE